MEVPDRPQIYRLKDPNFFCCPVNDISPFWKGVMWVSTAAKIGYRWKIGDGKSTRFWEDQWFRNSSLAIQFWPLYNILVEKGNTVAEAWDGTDLKFTFRRTVSTNLMNMWYEVCAIAESISFTDDCDAIIWSFTSSGLYSVQSLYDVVNFRGIVPLHSPSIWGICIPPRVQVFLWLLCNNKLLTRDNLGKRKKLDDASCIFCAEPESISHLFFECCVATKVWEACSEFLPNPVGSDFLSVARWWISNNKHAVLNTCISAILCNLWNVRNAICFQGLVWSGVKMVILEATRMMRRWPILYKDASSLENLVKRLEDRAGQPPRLAWGASTSVTAPMSQNWTAPGAGSLSAFGAGRSSDASDTLDRLSF